MKYVLILLTSFGMLRGCSQVAAGEEPQRIRYEASSRGYYYSITVDPKSIVIQSDREGSNIIEKATTKNQWGELSLLLKGIALEHLDDLDIPSENRAVDRAAIATLEIKYPKKNYVTDAFDHGNPPLAIRTLVDKLLQMAETIERQ